MGFWSWLFGGAEEVTEGYGLSAQHAGCQCFYDFGFAKAALAEPVAHSRNQWYTGGSTKT